MTEHVTRTGRTGRTVTIESRIVEAQGRRGLGQPLRGCSEMIATPESSLGWEHCGRGGLELYCDPGCGREERRKCYCDEHGGAERAAERLLEEWAVVAPDSVGGDYEVQEAGCASLTSVDVYVVTRPHEGRYVVALGIGGHTVSLRGSHPDREAATLAGVEAWRERVGADLEAIRAARGGTLDWGGPVRPRPEPIVIHAAAGQSAYAALRVREILALVPDAHVRTVPVCERWVNGHGTHAIAPEQATEQATEIAGTRGVAYVDGHDIVYVLPRPASGDYAPTLLGAENWSHRSAEQVAARIA